MPHLMVDLEDARDCRRAIGILKDRLVMGYGGAHRRGQDTGLARDEASGKRELAQIADLPLPQKLKRIQSRGMWKHLVRIARSAKEPMSLTEYDSLLDLPKNKMRSLKAIMAKLENRFGIQFLRVDPDAGVDPAGNPRYAMLPNVRRQILRLSSNQL